MVSFDRIIPKFNIKPLIDNIIPPLEQRRSTLGWGLEICPQYQAVSKQINDAIATLDVEYR